MSSYFPDWLLAAISQQNVPANRQALTDVSPDGMPQVEVLPNRVDLKNALGCKWKEIRNRCLFVPQ